VEATAQNIRERIGPRRVIASVSGGKDSAALSLHLRELGIEHDRVFMDTGWEHEATYEYLRGPLTKVLGPITEIRSKIGGLEDIVRKKGMFPSRTRRFCTEEAKVFPMRDYILAAQEDGTEVVNVVGIRAEESAARAAMPEWEESATFDCLIWRPILRWSEAEVIAIHKRHGLPPNPLYLMGASRVGCWPCIFARKSEIRLIADKDPARIERLRVLEDEVGDAARLRYERDLPERRAAYERDLAAWSARLDAGPTPEELAGTDDEPAQTRAEWLAEMAERKPQPLREFTKPAWFQSRLSSVDGGLTWPIDKVVEWSRTSRGGVQFDMFAADPADAGCMRWGMCDTKGDDDDEDDG
jgi:3'-phosphoadenosine 5'-phosphosulfate sulfotransferase (PAPS reductase)/FAD synthetase